MVQLALAVSRQKESAPARMHILHAKEHLTRAAYNQRGARPRGWLCGEPSNSIDTKQPGYYSRVDQTLAESETRDGCRELWCGGWVTLTT